MPSRFRPLFLRAVLAPCVALAALLPIAAPAQYKVVGADGRVTYTDRAPTGAEGSVTALGGRTLPAAAEVELPFELREAVARYPVVLYVANGACEPCEGGRALLRQRGIPYTEKKVLSAEDSEALVRLTGSRDAPTLTIGAQVVRGLAAEQWSSYLDAAGYPRESKLPATYQYKAATPVVERREAAAPPPAARDAEAPRRVERPLVTSGGIRF